MTSPAPGPALGSPIRLGRRTVRNRVVHLAVNTGFAQDHRPDRRLAEYWRSRAEGGVGAIVSGLTPVHESSVYKSSVLKNTGEEDLPALAAFADAVEGAGALAVLQLVHNGAQLVPRPGGPPPLSPSGVPTPGLGTTSVPISTGDIAMIINAFADAAERAQRAGLGGVEVHGAHGFLVHQFLSPLTNLRTDGYGGSTLGRATFARDVLDAIRERVGDAMVVGFRMVADEFAEGGIRADEAREIARLLGDQGHLDYVSVTAGNYGTLDHGISPMSYDDVPLAQLCRDIRQAVTVPVIAANRIRTPAQALELLRSGAADMVGLGRALIADPRWVQQLDTPERTRPCIVANACFAGGGVTTSSAIECAVNPRMATGTERGRPAHGSRARMVVVGAGVAGLTAALEATRAGLDVRVLERGAAAGGQIPEYDAALTFGRFGEYVTWLLGELRHDGVPVDFDADESATSLAAVLQQGDHLVLATGSRATPPPCTDLGGRPVIADGTVVREGTPWDRVLVLGDQDDLRLLLVARQLASSGKQTVLLTSGTALAAESDPLTRRALLGEFTHAGGRVEVGRPDGSDHLEAVDGVIWCSAREPVVPHGLDALLADPGVRVQRIGDCARPGMIVDATRSALAAVTAVSLHEENTADASGA